MKRGFLPAGIMIRDLNAESLRKPIRVLLVVFAAGCVFSIAVAQTALGAALALWLLTAAVGRRIPLRRTPFDYYFLAFVLIGVVSVVFAVEKGIVMPFAKRVALIPIVYIVFDTVRDRKMMAIVVTVLIAVMAVFSLIGIRIYLAGEGGLHGRLRLFNHYMTSGGILMILSLMTFGLAMTRAPLRIRASAAAAGAVMVVPLVFTFTRSSWLGFLAGLAVMSVLQNWKMIIPLAAAVAIFFAAAPDDITERAVSSFDPGHVHNIERTYMWRAGLDMMLDHPLTGVGDTDLTELYREYRPPGAAEEHGHLHNNIVMFSAMMGVPGLLVFFAMFGRILVEEIRIARAIPQGEWICRGAALGAVGVFTGFQVNGLFEWNFGDAEIAMLLWLTVGLSLAAGSIAARNSAKAAKEEDDRCPV